MSTTRSLEGKTVLITGANRGLGQALVEEALSRGAARVYATARRPLTHPDERVTPLLLDITDAAQVEAVASGIDHLDVLVNNAGAAEFSSLDDRAALERALAVNLYGPYAVANAFVPKLTASRGAVVNVLSILSLAPFPAIPAYSISKAAAFSFTQALRIQLDAAGVSVHAVLAGPLDTDMSRELPVEKAAPEKVARTIFDAVDDGVDDVFPDPMTEPLGAAWPNGVAKMLERENAAAMAAAAVAE